MDKVKVFVLERSNSNGLRAHKNEIEEFVNNQDIEIIKHQETYFKGYETVMVTLYYRETKPFEQSVYGIG